MNNLLRVAAVYSLAWAVVLAFPGWLPFDLGTASPEMRSMAVGLAIANLAAFLFIRAAAAPTAHRAIRRLLLFAYATWPGRTVLYVLEGTPAVMRLIDFVLSLALFTGMLNMLPGTLQGEESAPER